MKTFNRMAAQGDIMLIKIDKLPDDIKQADSENGQFIIAHSETGHNHIVKERPNVKFYKKDSMVSYLEVIEATDSTETLLEHLRSFDTHETIKINPGIYEVRRQREYVPEGWRRVED